MKLLQLFLFFVAVAVTASPNTATAANGEELFSSNCGICHQADGAGAPGVAPPLRSELWQRLGPRSSQYLASVLVSGLIGVPLDGQSYAAQMPSWAQLSDADLAAVATYVLQKLNGTKLKVTAATVKEARAAAPDVTKLKQLRDGS